MTGAMAGRPDLPAHSRCLVTGASGFIGSHLAAALAAAGHDVACLVRPESRVDFLSTLPVRLVEGDCRDSGSLRAAVTGVDYVFHLAGVITAPDRETFFAVNAGGTKNLAEACLEWNPALRRLVYVSSIAATGPSPRGGILNEGDECHPVSHYGHSKLAAEQHLRAAGDRLPWVIIRATNVLGPRQHDLERSVAVLRRHIKPLFGRKDSCTSVVGVWDLVRALLLAAADGRAIGRTYFVTDGKPVFWRTITDIVARAAGVQGALLPVPFPLMYLIAAMTEQTAHFQKTPAPITREQVLAFWKYDWVYSSDAIARELDFRPEMDLESVLAQTFEKPASGG